jgi:hypothetical protein
MVGVTLGSVFCARRSKYVFPSTSLRQPDWLNKLGSPVGSVGEAQRLRALFAVVTDRDLYVRTISDVIDYYGDTQVALTLNVRMDDLERWVAGKSRPPIHVFLRIIELKNQVKL